MSLVVAAEPHDSDDARRLMVIDDTIAPMRKDPRTDPVIPIDLRPEKERLIQACGSVPVRVGRLNALGSWGDAVLVARDARTATFLTDQFRARQVRKLFKALMPDPAAQQLTRKVAVIRTLAAKLESSREAPDISDVMDAVEDLLDRSVGAEEYVIRSAGGDPLIDLNELDFEQLALRFATNKRTTAKQIEKDIERRLDVAIRQNPTRIELAERFRALIDAYNAGAHRVERWREFDEYDREELFTERIPFRETRDYVKILTRNLAIYRGLYGGS